MKTREQLYNGEGATLIRLITTYHALRYEQIIKFFSSKPDSIKSLITSLIKQGRIYHDKETCLLCDSRESSNAPDYGMIAAFWVLLDFKEVLSFHTSGEFPVKLHFFAKDDAYEIIYIALGQETLVNHILERSYESDASRLIVLESKSQSKKLCINNVAAYCIVNSDGSVSYYSKKEVL